MKELLPGVRRALAVWGAPATMSATSPRDFPQNEQRTPRAFILAIILAISNLASWQLALRRATRGARLPHLLNHIPWPGWRINIDRARRRARSVRDFARCAWRVSGTSAHECG